LAELALLNASLQGLVEQNVKHLVRSIDAIVCLDIFLEGNTAVTEAMVSHELIKDMRRQLVNKIRRVKSNDECTDLLPCLSLSY
jgi:hypothetical protein